MEPDGPELPLEEPIVADADMPTRLPRPRPTEAGTPALSAGDGPEAVVAQPQPSAAAARQAAHAVAAIDMLNRAPRPRPGSAATLALIAPSRQEPPDDAPMAPGVPPEALSSGSDNACLARLAALGVKFTRLEPIGGACNVAAPLDVTSLGSGVAITPQATMNCRTAEALALWVRDSLVPAARIHLDAVPNRIIHDSTYVCRSRNNQRGAQLSEHAHANAVDIKAIGFADREPLDIRRYGPSGAKEDRFQLTVRQDSCRYFTTVLGPGSNAAHATHFHFDMAAAPRRLPSLRARRAERRRPRPGEHEARIAGIGERHRGNGRRDGGRDRRHARPEQEQRGVKRIIEARRQKRHGGVAQPFGRLARRRMRRM